jgi:Mg2+-importing ATPase
MSLKGQGEVVGMLRDGINDCVALRFAAFDHRRLRRYGASYSWQHVNILIPIQCRPELILPSIKYIKMVASSNFGNVFSILIASSWLPFDPMTSLQILIQNLLYDISQIAIPWDRMDPEYLELAQI